MGLGSVIVETLFGLVATGVIWLVVTVRDMGIRVKELLEMHSHPEDTGFGTKHIERAMEDMREELRELNRSMREMIHYQKWTAEQLNGRRPPPPPPYERGQQR